MFVVLLFLLAVTLSASAVIELTDSNFEDLVIRDTHSKWVIEFYAPWCKACQSVQPVIEQLSKYANHTVHVGRVNRSREKNIINTYGGKNVPAIFYKRFEKLRHYKGARSLEALKSLVDLLESDAVHIVTTEKDMHLVEEEDLKYSSFPNSQHHHLHENVSFVLTIPCKGFDNEQQCIDKYADSVNSFSAVAEEWSMRALFILYINYKIQDKAPTLCKHDISLQQHTPLTCLTGDHTTDIVKTTEFVTHNNHPLLVNFENHNYNHLAHLNKTMIIAVIDHRKTPTLYTSVVQVLNDTSFAFTQQKSLRDSVVFGYINGKKWRKFLEYYDLHLPALIVIDHDALSHITVALHGYEDIDASEVVRETINRVRENAIEYQFSRPPGIVRRIIYRVKEYYPTSLLLMAMPLLLILLSILFPRPNSQKKKIH